MGLAMESVLGLLLATVWRIVSCGVLVERVLGGLLAALGGVPRCEGVC